MPMARQHDLAVLPWGILSGGVLTGKFLNKVDEPTRVDPETLNLSEKKLDIVKEVVAIGEELGKTPASVAVNWVRQQQHRAQIVPILGARTESQLQANLDVLDWELEQEHLNRLDKISDFELGFPQSFIANNPFIYGHTYDSIDDHRGWLPVATYASDKDD